MILKLDPRWPLVWRDPDTLQVGIDPPRAVLGAVSSIEERLLSALAVGVTRDGLDVIADGRAALVDGLLDRLDGLLLEHGDPGTRPRVAVSGAGQLAEAVIRLLRDLGAAVAAAPEPGMLADARPDLAIALGHWVLPPELHSYWLRRDVPHLPAVFTDSAVHIGPLVEPGDGPCLLCIELHRRDDDVAWPAIATQLLGRAAGAEHPALVAEAAAAIARLALSRLADGPVAARSVRIGIAGDRGERVWTAHPDCGCRGIAHLAARATGPRESGSADAASAPAQLPTRTGTAAAALE